MDFKIRKNIIILSPIPFYYHIPIYKCFAENININFNVFYCSNWKQIGQEYFDYNNLLDGYNYEFLKNYSSKPSLVNFFGLINWGIIKEIKKNNYNVFVLQSWGTLTSWLAFFACLIYKIPIVFMTDANVFSEEKKSKFKKIFLKFLFGHASGFWSQGTVNKEFYKYYNISDGKILEMPFSWGYEWFLQKADELKNQKKLNRENLGIKDEDFVFLIACRLEKEKNIFLLLDAYSKVNFKDKKLFILGQGSLEKEIKNYIEKNKIENVFLEGFKTRDELINYYNVADTFVLPSLHEPWGMVVNEAMCFGLPVIASNKVGAAVDLIKNEYNGFIFNVNSREELKNCMEKAMSFSNEELQIFSKNAKRAIEDWIKRMNPSKKIVNILERLNK